MVRFLPMSEEVKTHRPYRSAQRAERASETRRAVLAAARKLFVDKGYAGTTVAQIADDAGVNVDTLYAAVGRKPAILRAVVESAISGRDQPVPADERDYVVAIRAARTAGEKIDRYAAALAEMGPRTAPIFRALRDAAATDQLCAALYAEITERRRVNMGRFAEELRATGSVRADLPDDEVADIVWSMNSHEYYLLFVHDRGWSAAKFGAHLADAWRRLLLDPAVAGERPIPSS